MTVMLEPVQHLRWELACRKAWTFQMSYNATLYWLDSGGTTSYLESNKIKKNVPKNLALFRVIKVLPWERLYLQITNGEVCNFHQRDSSTERPPNIYVYKIKIWKIIKIIRVLSHVTSIWCNTKIFGGETFIYNYRGRMFSVVLHQACTPCSRSFGPFIPISTRSLRFWACC